MHARAQAMWTRIFREEQLKGVTQASQATRAHKVLLDRMVLQETPEPMVNLGRTARLARQVPQGSWGRMVNQGTLASTASMALLVLAAQRAHLVTLATKVTPA